MKNLMKFFAIILMLSCIVTGLHAEVVLTDRQMELSNEIMTAITTSEEEKVVIKGIADFDECSLIRTYISNTYFSGKSLSYSSGYYYENGVKLIKMTIKPATLKALYEKYCSKEFIPIEDKPVEPEIVVPEEPVLAESVQVVVDDIMTTALTRTGNKVRINDVNSINDFKEARKHIQNEYLDNKGYFGYTAKLNSNTNKVEVVINADSIREAYNTYGTKEYVIENKLEERLLPYVEEIMTKILTYKGDVALITEFNSWGDWDAVKVFLNAKYFNKTGISYLNASINKNTGKLLVRINVPMSKANYIGGYTINEAYVKTSILDSTEKYTIRNEFSEVVIPEKYQQAYNELVNLIFKTKSEQIYFEYTKDPYWGKLDSYYVKITDGNVEFTYEVENGTYWEELIDYVNESYFRFNTKQVAISGSSSNASTGVTKGYIQVKTTKVNYDQSEKNRNKVIALAESFNLTGNKVADLITINNYLSNRSIYAYNADISNITSFLNKTGGNCYCVSKTMELVCDYIGIEVDTVGGEMISGTGHCWNSVVVDGSTYYMDLTWNKGHTYWFLMDRTTFEIDHIFD